jgi:glyoxylase-like metal-dependent hydrolase (beta-lactamase superfamily II)
MSQTEWDFWTSAPDLSSWALDGHVKQMLLSSTQKNLPPIKDHIELIDGEKELVPGVVIVSSPGHTPGHVAVSISSRSEVLLHIVDAVLHPMHLEHPGWHSVFDLDESLAVTTRKRLLDRATADSAQVLAYHFPFPGLGRVVATGNAWKWESPRT